MCLDPDFSPDEQEEKARLIAQVNINNTQVVQKCKCMHAYYTMYSWQQASSRLGVENFQH